MFARFDCELLIWHLFLASFPECNLYSKCHDSIKVYVIRVLGVEIISRMCYMYPSTVVI